MVHFVNELSLSPKTFWLVDENEILVTVINHAGNVVHVEVLQEDEELAHVSSMGWSSEHTLASILEVHVVVVVTVSNGLKTPARSILELLWNLMPTGVLSNPVKGWSTISSVNFENVETWGESESAESESLPETGPLNNSSVLVDGLASLEAECGIWVHGWGLNEWLKLVTWVSWGTLETENALNWLLTKDWVSETGSNVWELLLISPLNLVFVSLIVIVVRSHWSGIELLLEVDLLSLREPSTGWLSPSVVVLEVHVVEMELSVFAWGNLSVL